MAPLLSPNLSHQPLQQRTSILWHGGIHFIRPGQDSALEVPNFSEAGLTKKLDGFGRSFPAPAMCHDFARAVQFVRAPRQITEWEQVSIQIANLKFMRLANVKHKQIVAAIESLLQLERSHFRYIGCGRCRLLATNSAEFLVVN